MWPFRDKEKSRIDQEQQNKIALSQKILLDAAISTVDVAQYVTTKLKQNLEDAIKQFDATVSIMSDALFICDLDGNIKACNPASERIFHCENIINESILSFFNTIHDEKIENIETLWNILTPKETTSLNGVSKNGTTFPVEITKAHLGKSDGSVSILVLIRDASDTIKTDYEANAQNYRSIFELCTDGIIVVQRDHIVAANKESCQIFGCENENELLGLSFRSVINLQCENQLNKGCANCDKNDCIYRVRANGKKINEANATMIDGTSISLLYSVTNITWNDDSAYLICFRQMNLNKTCNKPDHGIDRICSFDSLYKIIFVNDSFRRHYNIKSNVVGYDVRNVISKKENIFLVSNIKELNVDNPTRRTQYKHKNNVQDWINHAVYTGDKLVEYQLFVRDVENYSSSFSE